MDKIMVRIVSWIVLGVAICLLCAGAVWLLTFALNGLTLKFLGVPCGYTDTLILGFVVWAFSWFTNNYGNN